MPESRRRLLWSIAYSVVGGTAFLAAVLLLSRALEETRWVVHTVQAWADAGRVLEAALEEEVGARGYLIAAEPDYLTPYLDGSRRLISAVENFRARTADNPHQQGLAAVLDDEARGLDAALALAVADAKVDPAGARREFHQLGTRRRMDAIRGLVAEARAEEDRLLRMRVAAADRDFRLMNYTLYGAAGLIVLGSLPARLRWGRPR